MQCINVYRIVLYCNCIDLFAAFKANKVVCTYITPLLKKPSLDAGELKNYRRVSNLTFMSKVVDRIVAEQLLEYLQANDSNLVNSFNKLLHKTASRCHDARNVLCPACAKNGRIHCSRGVGYMTPRRAPSRGGSCPPPI